MFIAGLQAEEWFCGHTGSTGVHHCRLLEDGVSGEEQSHRDAVQLAGEGRGKHTFKYILTRMQLCTTFMIYVDFQCFLLA